MRGFAAFAVLASLCLASCAKASARAPQQIAGTIGGQLDPITARSQHRIVNSTGNIVLGLPSALDAELMLGTSGVYATEFSLEITPLPGDEPNKQARAVIGKAKGNIEVASRRGENPPAATRRGPPARSGELTNGETISGHLEVARPPSAATGRSRLRP